MIGGAVHQTIRSSFVVLPLGGRERFDLIMGGILASTSALWHLSEVLHRIGATLTC